MTPASMGGNRGARHIDPLTAGHEARVLTGELRQTAEAIVARYPNSRSAALPLLFLVQSVEGHVTEQGMRDVADILGLTPAEILATGSFYTMLKKNPQGEYLVSVCRNISCTHMGARKVLAELEEHLGIEAGQTTADGKITLESAECLATCDGAPSLQINYEDFYRVAPDVAVQLVEKLRRGDEVRSVRGEPVKTSKEISYETATVGLRSPGTAGDHVQETFGGESMLGHEGAGFRPKEPGGGETWAETRLAPDTLGDPGRAESREGGEADA
jgi:NADH:ubiquinone oxidoreductase subunit E